MTTSTNKVAYSNTGYSNNTGKYINYDTNSSMGANAYGAAYNSGGQLYAPTPVDNNSVTALSVKGSGSFLPSSFFQWFILILLIIAIIIVARMIAKKSATNNEHHAVPAH